MRRVLPKKGVGTATVLAVVLFFAVLVLSPSKLDLRKRRLKLSATSSSAGTSRRRKTRILYIVTSLAEYNTGKRATIAQSDRLSETTIPVVTEGISSMVESGRYDVDLFLVCHYTLRPEREGLVRAALPPGVGLEIWNDATPLGYKTDSEPFTKLINRTEHLARQHRFVINAKHSR
jgi:hypothetical protein